MFLYRCLYNICMFWLIDTRPKTFPRFRGDHFVSPGGLHARALYIQLFFESMSLSSSYCTIIYIFFSVTYPAFQDYFELEETGRDFSSSSILSSSRAISASMLSSFSLNISLYSWSESERSGIHLDSAIRCIRGFDVLCAFSICHASTRLKTLWPQ